MRIPEHVAGLARRPRANCRGRHHHLQVRRGGFGSNRSALYPARVDIDKGVVFPLGKIVYCAASYVSTRAPMRCIWFDIMFDIIFNILPASTCWNPATPPC
jgi:hypothetical protein